MTEEDFTTPEDLDAPVLEVTLEQAGEAGADDSE